MVVHEDQGQPCGHSYRLGGCGVHTSFWAAACEKRATAVPSGCGPTSTNCPSQRSRILRTHHWSLMNSFVSHASPVMWGRP